MIFMPRYLIIGALILGSFLLGYYSKFLPTQVYHMSHDEMGFFVEGYRTCVMERER